MTKTLLLRSTCLAVAAFAAVPAMAQNNYTPSGTSVNNVATVEYTVAGTTVTTSDNDVFVVDRLINLAVAAVDTTPTQITQGQNDAQLYFTLTNNSNETLDFDLSTVVQASGTTAAHGGTDSLDPTTGSVLIYWDANGNGVIDTAENTPITRIEDLPADGVARIIVTADFPVSGVTNGAISTIQLQADALTSTGTALPAASTTNGVGTIDTVYGDAAGVATGDTARDGTHSAADDYRVTAPVLTIQKSSVLVSDPINGTTNPMMIPGAIVRYCIVVNNAAGASTATGLTVRDAVPTTLEVQTATIRVGGTTNPDGTCNTSTGAAGGTFVDPNFSWTVPSLAAGSTTTVVFDAKVR